MSLHAGTDSHDELPPRPISAAERLLLMGGLVALALLCFTVAYTVVMRAAGGPLIPDDVQIVRQLLVVVIIFPMAAVTAARMHIAVTVFSNWLATRQKHALTLLGDILGLALFSVLLAGAIELFFDTFRSGEYFDGTIQIPYWFVHGAYAVALAALWLRMLTMTWVDFGAARMRSVDR
ncbi:MAG: TRAP transporter small permease [Pseudolabrys sp.]